MPRATTKAAATTLATSSRFTARDYAIMKRVAGETVKGALQEFEARLPAIVTHSVNNTFELIGIDVTTSGARDNVRSKLASLTSTNSTLNLIRTKGIDTIVYIVVTLVVGALVGGATAVHLGH